MLLSRSKFGLSGMIMQYSITISKSPDRCVRAFLLQADSEIIQIL
jgi:hypothetical protein